MSRWLRKTMQLAGIACHFTGHSTRSATTSAAARAGVPLDTILVAADWSSSQTFSCFYLRSPDKGQFLLLYRNNWPYEHVLLYLKDTDTFSVGDPPFLCGPLVLLSVLLFIWSLRTSRSFSVLCIEDYNFP